MTVYNEQKYDGHVSSSVRDNGGRSIAKLLDHLKEIQWRQLEHDERYHKEITLLPVADRMKHFALHFAKYVGYFSEAIDSENSSLYERALIDAFIICVASANTLNIDLQKALLLPEAIPAVTDPMSFLKQAARHSGRLAKSCESLDHVEAYPFREQMTSSVLELFCLVVAESYARNIDLVGTTERRLTTLESKSIFHGEYSRLR